MRSGRVHGKGSLAAAQAQRAELGASCKGSWAGQGGNTQIEAQCIPTSHGRSIADANALPGVLHAIAQRRPRAHFRAGDDTAELAILPPPRDRDRSRVAALYVPVGALRVCPCIAESRGRRTDAAWSNSSGTRRPGTGQYYVYPRKITDQHTYTTHSTDSTNEHQQQIYIQQYSKQIKRGLVRTEP